MNATQLIVPPAAYPYLVAQNGALDDMKGDPATWCDSYADVLASRFHLIRPYLPETCDAVMDIGGGLGGIDALICEYYNGCHVTIVDGIDDPPDVQAHSKTFSHMNVASEFLALNGVRSFDFIDANKAPRSASRFYDLIVSFRSWCFHLPPDMYLELVLSCVIPNQTKLIIDVRCMRNAPQLSELYMGALTKNFRHLGCIFTGVKFETHWFMAE